MDATLLRRNRLLLALVIVGSCIGCDQATKGIATRTLQHAPPQSFLGDTFRLDFALNPGGFLSLGSELPPGIRRAIFVAVNAGTMLALAAFLIWQRQLRSAEFVALVFVLAGGLGNLIDRIGNAGLVTDFMNVGIGPLRTGVFNVADMAVLFGAIGFGLLSLRRPPARAAVTAPPSPAT